jgi:hypothetical protein
MTLDELGLIEGTDKSSLNHDYLRHYEAALTHLQDRPINILELGVQGGQSLRMWKRFFPLATVVGVDMNPQCRQHASEQIHVYIGSQDDPALLGQICDEFPPDVVVDDASHRGGETIASLEILFPRLAPGGIYIVEDLFFHYGAEAEEWRSYATHPVATYFADKLATVLATRRCTRPEWGTHPIFDELDWFSVINSAVILRKKNGPPCDFDTVRALLIKHNASPRAWEVLCESIVRQHGPLAAAEEAIRKAVELAPTNDRFHRHLSLILGRRGDHAGALAEATTAHRLAPTPENVRRLEVLREREHQLQASVAATPLQLTTPPP